MPPPIAPRPPEHLSPDAARVWSELAPDLERHGVLTSWDGPLFECFCEAVAQHHRAKELIQPGLLIKGRRPGELRANPGWRIYRDSAHLVRQLASEFGLTPASRSNVRTYEPPEAEMDSLFTPIRPQRGE
jgi:P27 family predicted phage terminase small subunit